MINIHLIRFLRSQRIIALSSLNLLVIAIMVTGCSLGGSAPLDESATRTAIAGTAFALAWTQAAELPAATQIPPSPPPVETPTELQPPPDVALKNYTWNTQVVDEKGRVGLYTSLVVDQNDNPHVIYLDDERDILKYGVYKDDAWHLQAFDSPNNDGYYGSLALDSSGAPHLTRYILNIQWIAYTYFTGREWPPVDFIKNVNVASTSLQLNQQGEPQMAYFDINAGELRYASHISYGGWNTLTIARTTEAGKTFPVVLDADDQAHFCFYSENEGLKYATVINNSPNLELVDPGWNIGLYPALALDAGDNPHISYYDDVNGALKYAHWNGTAWEVQVVDSGGVGKFSSIDVDPASGLVHISYWDETNGALKFAVGSGSQWQLFIIDSGKVGEYTSLGLDKAGNPHISYYDKANDRLKYAFPVTQ